MNARGSTEVIVATIGLSVGALDTTLFTLIVTMAVVTTLLMPPMLRWAFSRIPVDEDEREQLERAEFEERGFVAGLERVLLATDDSASGRLASYLVGLITAPRGIPVTALASDTPAADLAAVRHFQGVRDAMEQAAVRTQAEAVPGDALPEIDLIARQSDEPAEHAVAQEARRGYDLLVMGLEPVLSGGAEVSPRLARVAKGFERTVGIVSARGRDARDAVSAGRRILLPVIGAAYSREAADFGLALAETSGARITALYVATAGERTTWRRRLSRSLRLADAADAALRDVLDLSRHYSVNIRTAIESRSAPEDAILKEVHHGRHDLVVLGVVGARPGDSVFPGSAAAALLERSPCSLLLLTS
jgi:nucleotide-binding universal stress UspA family protein